MGEPRFLTPLNRDPHCCADAGVAKPSVSRSASTVPARARGAPQEAPEDRVCGRATPPGPAARREASQSSGTTSQPST